MGSIVASAFLDTRSVQARDMLGWTPRFNVLDGIRHAMQWAAVHPDVPGA